MVSCVLMGLILIFHHLIACIETSTNQNLCHQKLPSASLPGQLGGCFKDTWKDIYDELSSEHIRPRYVRSSRRIIEKASLAISSTDNLTVTELGLLMDAIHISVNSRIMPVRSLDPVAHYTKLLKLSGNILSKKNTIKLKQLSKEHPIGIRFLEDMEIISKQMYSSIVRSRRTRNGFNDTIEVPTDGFNFTLAPCKRLLHSDQKDENIIEIKNGICSNYSAMTSCIYHTIDSMLPTNSCESSSCYGNNTETHSRYINSQVVSVSIYDSIERKNENEDNDDDLVIIRLKHKRRGRQIHKGVFWKETGVRQQGYWSNEGCRVISETEEETAFTCNHLTNFALLVIGEKAIEDDIISFITTFGCAVSLASLVACLSVFGYARVKSQRRKILTHLVICLIIIQLLFICGLVRAVRIKELCICVALALFYFQLAAFCWMLNMGGHLWDSTLNVLNRKISGTAYVWVGYGVPLMIVLLSIAFSNAKLFDAKKYCFLSSENGALWALLGPLFLALVINVGIVARVLRIFLATTQLQVANKQQKLNRCFRAVAVLTPVMGLTWSLAGFCVLFPSPVLQYMFTLMNSFQGVYIFVTTVIMDKRVRLVVSKRFSKASKDSRTFH